jgi:hypothetical protein
MNIVSMVIIIFLVLETLNVIMLYFTPGTRRGNGLGVFQAYEKSKENPEIHRLVQYLINWVAGTKLIFIALLLVILITGDRTTQFFGLIALILSVTTFFWRLYPMIKSMDADGQLSPSGYSRTLALMIAGFLVVFIAAAIISRTAIFSPYL